MQDKRKELRNNKAAITGLSPNTQNTASTGKEEEQWNRWGHEFSGKPTNMIRILLQNVGGIDLTAGGSVKLAALHAFMQDYQVNIAALTECNMGGIWLTNHLTPRNKPNSGGKTHTGP